jgi:hypothetical protein
MKRHPHTLSFFVVLIIGSTSLAQNSMSKSIGGEAEVGMQYGLGSMENFDGSVPSRSANTTSLFSSLGWRFWKVIPFALIEYRFISQSKAPDQVNNQNLSGDGYLMGAGLKYRHQRTSFALGYSFFGSYKLTKKTTDGATSTYSKRILKSHCFLFILRRPSQVTLEDKDYDISTNTLNHGSYAVGFSYLL